MGKVSISLTILFENPFWIGLFEREEDGYYEVCKVTFGAEPKDNEVFEFIKTNWKNLRFSPSLTADASVEKRINPKRMQRLIHKQTQTMGIGTKAQQALKLLQEQGKQEHQKRSREQREAMKQLHFEQHQKKRKDKHRGH